ncbi:g2958 [Coccomyxa elongata]
MTIQEEEYVEDEEYDEEDDEDEYDIDEQEDGDVEDADMEEMDQLEVLQNAGFIRGLEPLLAGRGASGAPSGAPRRAPQQEVAREWMGLRQLPATTQTTFLELLGKLRDKKKTKLTILLLGKTGVGKSSTANSILAERVANVAALQSDTSKAQCFSRVAAGFTLSIIDTPGVLEGDAINGAALSGIVYEVKGRPVDAVLFLNRLDDFRVDASDIQVIEGVTRALGETVWNNTFIGLTHGRLTSLPDDLTYDEYVERRAGALREAIYKHSGAKAAELPVVLIENSSRAAVNSDGEKLLGNKRPWLPDLMRQVTQKSMEWTPYRYDPSVVRRNDPNKKRRWLIPLVLLAQIAFKVFVLDRVLEEDGITGDAYGPYDAEFIQEERERIARDKERERARKRREAEKQKQQSASQKQGQAPAVPVYDDDDVDDDYEDDEEE